MKMNHIVAGLFVAGALASGFAYAMHEPGHEGDHKGQMFKEADTNNDGKVSHDEFKAQHDKHGEEMFKRMDANGDGFIDEAEKKAMHDKMGEHCERKGSHK